MGQKFSEFVQILSLSESQDKIIFTMVMKDPYGIVLRKRGALRINEWLGVGYVGKRNAAIKAPF